MADYDLDYYVAALSGEIAQNSACTNRIDKALLAKHNTRTREDALLYHRTRP